MTQFSELHDVWSKRWTQLSSFRALVFLLLTQSCAGRVQVVGPSQPVVATVGDDVVLSCRLEPAVDASDMSVEWSREDLKPPYVYVWWDGEELESSKHPSYKGRTSLLVSKLELGDVSLKLSKVKLSDKGMYRCFIPTLGRESTVELVVGTDPSTVISLAGLGRTSSSVELQCKSAGWYPQPEVLWLDGEGKLLSAGPTETVRGPDDLYTVSSRVTVEKRHSNKFTCRVHQNNIHQTREALIQVTDDFFKVQSSNTSTIVGLAVSFSAAVIILLILAVVLFVHTRRQNRKMKTLVNEKQQENKRINNQLQQEREERMKVENEVKNLHSRLEELEGKNSETNNQLQQEKQNNETLKSRLKELKEEELKQEQQRRRKEAEDEIQSLKEELNMKKDEVETKQAELQRLQEEKKKIQDDLETLNKDLQTKNTELKTVTDVTCKFFQPFYLSNTREEKQRKEGSKNRKHIKLKNLIKQLRTKKMEFQTKDNEINNQLQQETKKREKAENDVKTLKSRLEELVLRGPITLEEVHHHGDYIRLKNISTEEIELEGWWLIVQRNYKEPAIYTFNESLKLQSGGILSLRRPYCSSKEPYDVDLEWSDLWCWSATDQLQITLVSNKGETYKLL